MGHTVTEYLTRIRNRVGDLGVRQALPETNLLIALEEARATFARDKPRIASFTDTGDGTTYAFDLTADTDNPWIEGWSRLVDIEHPTGLRVPEMLELRNATEREGTVTLHDTTPANGTGIRIRYATIWPYPTDTAADDLIPEIFYQAITALAASNIVHGLAVEAARKHTKTIQTTVVELDAGALFSAAAELRRAYEAIVLGRPAVADGAGTGNQVAMAVSDLDIFDRTLFHHRDTAHN